MRNLKNDALTLAGALFGGTMFAISESKHTSILLDRPTREQRGMPLRYSPQEEDRKHGFVRRKFRQANA